MCETQPPGMLMGRISCFSDKKKPAALLGLLVFAVLLTAILWAALRKEKAYKLSTFSMGSAVQQTVYGKSSREAAAKAASTVAELENQISWRREGSEIAKLNENAGKAPIEIKDDTWELLSLAQEVSEKSGGAFDCTIAPVSRLWDFDGEPRLPEPEALKDALKNVDHTLLSLGKNGKASLKKESAALDLGALGKGAACTAAVKAYGAYDVKGAVVAVGGSVGLYGEKPGGKPWRVAVRDPETSGSLGELSLLSGYVSTSGSYEKRFTQDGKTYHHLLDPKTGYPAESGLLSVTVWSEEGALSDALSTACFVLGLPKSLPVLKSMKAQAVFVTTEQKVYVTQGLKDKFVLTGEGYTLGGAL